MPPMPATIQLGPLSYTIQHSHEALTAFQKTDGCDVYGVAQNRICNIIIDEGYPLAREQRTLLHEVIHALQTIWDMEELKAGDEHYIRLLATGLLDMIQRNPDLVLYLTGAE